MLCKSPNLSIKSINQSIKIDGPLDATPKHNYDKTTAGYKRRHIIISEESETNAGTVIMIMVDLPLP